MKDEIKEILSKDNIHIIECDKNWCNAYGYEKSQLKEDLLDYITNLQKENEHLRTQVNTYENPDDYTLFYMWLDTRSKDKIKQLQQENERLKEKENKLQEKFKDWKKEIEKERKHYLCDRTDCCGRIKNSRKYNSIYQELKTYKSRCEKANEYIKKNTHEYKMFNEELGHFSNLTNISIDKNNKVFINDLLKILGGDE